MKSLVVVCINQALHGSCSDGERVLSFSKSNEEGKHFTLCYSYNCSVLQSSICSDPFIPQYSCTLLHTAFCFAQALLPHSVDVTVFSSDSGCVHKLVL